jgi:hypothetical protein
MLCKFQMVIHLHAYYLHHTAKINQNLAVGQCSPAVITGICCKTKPVLGSGTDFSSSYYRNPLWKCRHKWHVSCYSNGWHRRSTFFLAEAPWLILAAVVTRFLVDRLNINWNSKQKYKILSFNIEQLPQNAPQS